MVLHSKRNWKYTFKWNQLQIHTSRYIAIPWEKGGDERLTLYVYLNRQRNLVRDQNTNTYSLLHFSVILARSKTTKLHLKERKRKSELNRNSESRILCVDRGGHFSREVLNSEVKSAISSKQSTQNLWKKNYCINNNEISSENMTSSHVKITCYIHVKRSTLLWLHDMKKTLKKIIEEATNMIFFFENFACIAFKLEKIGPTFWSFNPRPSWTTSFIEVNWCEEKF